MSRVIIEICPRAQFREFIESERRFACVVAHRRAGKTFGCVQKLIQRAVGYKREGPPCRYGYIAPTRDQAKDIAWQYLTDYSSAIPGVKFNQAELAITYPNKSVVRLYSGDSYERMRGLYFDGVVVDEPADIDPNAWPYVIMPCLSDYSGWATFIGTCKGRNAFYRMFHRALNDENWFVMALKASESGIIPAAELATLRANMTEDAYKQEYECDWTVGIAGAIYAKYVEDARQQGRVGKIPVSGCAPVWTAWDLGAPLNTVVWYFQVMGRTIQLVRCDRGMDETIVQRVARMKKDGINYAGHLFPHDGGAKMKNGRTLADEAREAGLANVIVVPPVSAVEGVWWGVNHVQQLFPQLEFAAPGSDEADPLMGALDALSCYHVKVDEAGLKVYDEPVHDWSSHTADALRTMGEAWARGLFKFKHAGYTPDEPEYDDDRVKQKRRGLRPIRLGG